VTAPKRRATVSPHTPQGPVALSERDARLMRIATYAAVSVACLLIVVKMGAWLLTDSVSVLATLVDSLLDAAASLVNLYAVRQALQPADREHRFGHGKAEPLAGLGQSAFIAGSAVFLLIEAGHRLWHPQAVEHGAVGIGVMVFSIAVTLGLVAFQMRVVRRTKSVAISADSLHYRGDLLVNLGVIVALVGAAEFGWRYADPLIGGVIAAYIVWNAWSIFHESLNHLMDREFDEAERNRIKEIVLGHPEVLALHDLRTRTSGRDSFIQLHMELHGSMSLLRAHDVSDEVELKIRRAFPGAEVIIHQDPFGLEQPPGRSVTADA
jgi:ferrous-iron efflux pump FieF